MSDPSQGPTPFPSGRSAILHFERGAPRDLIRDVVTEVVWANRARRNPRSTWAALIGELLMLEGRPVVVLSPAIPEDVIETIRASLEMFPFRLQRTPASKLVFRGMGMVWASKDFEQIYPAKLRTPG